MNNDWLDGWHASVKASSRWWGRVLFFGGAVALLTFASVVWWLVTGDSGLKSAYWAVQTATTVGYGTGWSEFNEKQLVVCICAMLALSTYWACALSLLGSAVAEWKVE